MFLENFDIITNFFTILYIYLEEGTYRKIKNFLILLEFITNLEPAFKELMYLIRGTGNLATIAETRPNGAHKQFVSLLKCE